MRNWIALTAMLLLAATPARGEAPASKDEPREASGTKMPAIDPMEAVLGMTKIMDAIFPAGPEPDPARLAAAREASLTMLPNGTYAKAINGFMDRTIDRVLDMSEADLAAMLPPSTPAKDEKAKGKSKAKKSEPPKAPLSTEPLRVSLAKKEPNFDAKLAAIKAFAAKMLEKVGAVAEPKFRDGVARVLARRFDDRQLGEIRAFLATPTGAEYGRQVVGLWFEPEVMRGAFQILPDLMKMLPEMQADGEALDARMKSLGEPAPGPKTR